MAETLCDDVSSTVEQTSDPTELLTKEPSNLSSTDLLAGNTTQACQLCDALQAVQSIWERQSALSSHRDAALCQREALLASWVKTESEEPISELSRLDARAQAFAAKARHQARLDQAFDAFWGSESPIASISLWSSTSGFILYHSP